MRLYTHTSNRSEKNFFGRFFVGIITPFCEPFSGANINNQIFSDMKPSTIIDNYCRLYGVTMPKIDFSQEDYFVAISCKEVRVMPYHRSKILGQIVCNSMKQGVVLHVRNGWVKPLGWDRWKQFWAKYFAPLPRKSNLPEPTRIKRQPPSMFEQGKGERQRKKAKSGSFEATFRGNMNLHLMGTPIPTRPIA